MKSYNEKMGRASAILDRVAQGTVFAAVLLVVGNILLRVLFKSPILGAYDYIGLLTALTVGLALPYCAFRDGNIAVDFFSDKLQPKIKIIGEALMGIISFLFFVFATWHIGIYAYSMFLTGQVTPASKTPVYYFALVVALGIFMLCLIILGKLMESLSEVFKR